jgi:hypothetical protein
MKTLLNSQVGLDLPRISRAGKRKRKRKSLNNRNARKRDKVWSKKILPHCLSIIFFKKKK